ncbi:MAG: amino acid transporter, partial [Bacteroidales bacterium]|nr:amino acid transporter [Bacteroidales bacterium]
VVTHVFMIGYGILTHIPVVTTVAGDIQSGFHHGLTSLGGWGMMLLFLHAYSLGGGTYTGIEAVSNGLQIMREPKVQTGKRTMVYLASSLAITAGGIFICYLLLGVHHVEGQTLNAVLAGNLFNHWGFGRELAFITIFSEGALLFVAAQAGFIDGPRVMANMAIDSWFPHRFAALSNRLTMRNGVVMMGVAALFPLIYTHGAISKLIVMYSINVFLTFSISQLGMSTFFIKKRKKDREWKKHLSVHLVGLALCVIILIITTIEKFGEGGWVTILITSVLIGACYAIKTHYTSVKEEIGKLDRLMTHIPTTGTMNRASVNPQEMTAIQLVSGFSGFGVHTFLSIVRNFPHVYKNFIFVSVAVIDSGTFKGAEEIKNLDESIRDSLKKYVELARKLGFPAESRYETGTDVVEIATRVCKQITNEFPRSTVFTGQLTFRLEKSYHKLLHNETAFAIQRHLQWEGVTTVILPIRVEA